MVSPSRSHHPFRSIVGWQEGAQETNDQERKEYPAIGTVFALAGTQIYVTEERRARHQHTRDREDGPSRMAEERGKPATAEDRQER